MRATLHKLIYQINVIPIKIPAAFVQKLSADPKLLMKMQELKIVKIILKKNWRTHYSQFQNLLQS